MNHMCGNCKYEFPYEVLEPVGTQMLCHGCKELGEKAMKHMSMRIVRNVIVCARCGDEIESYSVHDFKYCSCKKVAVDGGKDYLRRLGNPEDFTDVSILTNKNEEEN